MQSDKFIRLMTDARWFDLTQAMSIFTPPWPGEMPLQIQFFKRLQALLLVVKVQMVN